MLATLGGMWKMRCPNCGANVRVAPMCERCGAQLPSEGRQPRVRIEGARQRAARRAAERDQIAPDATAHKGGAKRRGGTLADFFNAQAQRQATRDRIPATPVSPQTNQKVRKSWLPIRSRLSSGPIRRNAAHRDAQPPVPPQLPHYPVAPDFSSDPQPQRDALSYDGYRQQAYSQQQVYDQSAPPDRHVYEQAPRIEEQAQPQNYAQLYATDDQGHNQVHRSYSDHDGYAKPAPHGYDLEHQESQTDIDDAWEAGYRATLGTADERHRSRRGRKDKTRRGEGDVSVPDMGAMHDSSRTELGSRSRSWNIIGVPSASQHISGPISSSRHYVPMVPLEEMAAMPVPQGYPNEVRRYPAARPHPQQVIAGMSRLTFNLLLLGLVLCILAVPAFIALQRLPLLLPRTTPMSTAQKTIVPTPQLAQGFAGFLNDDFSIAYPTSWHQSLPSASSHTVSFSDGKDTSAKVTTSNALPATELQHHLDVIAHGFNGVVPQTIASGQRKTYSNAVWLENDYAITVVRGNTTLQIELRVLTIDYGANTYDILLSVPRADFSQTNSKYFEPMLRSFRFQ